MRWGLVPFAAKDIKVGFANINAKAEGIESKPAFREAFQRQRCLVPVDNFYEWKKTTAGKQPFYKPKTARNCFVRIEKPSVSLPSIYCIEDRYSGKDAVLAAFAI
jgi:putative SOS response-associated peptidase YedK